MNRSLVPQVATPCELDLMRVTLEAVERYAKALVTRCVAVRNQIEALNTEQYQIERLLKLAVETRDKLRSLWETEVDRSNEAQEGGPDVSG